MMRTSYGTCFYCKEEFSVQVWFDNLPIEDGKEFMWICPNCKREQHANNIVIRVEEVPPDCVGVVC